MGKRGRFLEQSDLSHPLDMKGNTGLFSETTCTQSNRDAQGPDLQLVSRLGSCYVDCHLNRALILTHKS